MHLSFIIGRSITLSAVNYNNAISRIHRHWVRENFLDWLLERCLAGPSQRNSIFQGQVLQMHGIAWEPTIERRKQHRIREALADSRCRRVLGAAPNG